MQKLHRITAAAAAVGLLAGLGATSASAAAKSVSCPSGLKIAFMGALSGDNGALGQNMVNGATIAFDEWNKANPKCKIEFAKKGSSSFDSQGDPAQASPLADKLVSNKKIIGLIGPGFSGETKATMPKYEEAGLPMITPGATNAKLSENGWKMFHRILANDDKQAPGIAKLMTATAKFKKVVVIDDASEYGKGLADSVRAGLGSAKVADDTIDPKGSDFSAAVNKVKGAGADAVFYGGYYAEAAKLVKQLRDAGVTAAFVSGDGSLDQKFVDNAGAAAEGAWLTATGAPSDINPDFAAKFQAKFKTAPAIYSPEAYDCAQVFLAGIKAGNTTRAKLAKFVANYDAPGITKQIKFTPAGEVAGDAVYAYQVVSGKIVSKGIIK